jgi:two-component system LytT family sensor kinase
MLIDNNLQKELEVNIIKYHMNPHFLNNFLNNLYSLALSKSDKTPETILLFSEVIRYINISSTMQKVSIENEINIIKKIINLFLIKFSKEVDIKINFEKKSIITEIEPMILIPLVYNALIFSDITETQGFININTSYDNNKFIFQIQFSHFFNEVSSNFDYNADITLENIKKILSLKYGNKANIFVHNKDYITNYVLNIYK